ncbi:MAG: ABC transporter substrate-binding protein, partial [Flavobacteriaceae bacterium]
MMKVNLLRVLFFVVWGVSICWGQNKQWESMYSYYNTTTGVAYNETLIVAAENALFLYNPNLNSTETFTTVDGLSGDNFSALVVYDNTIIAGFEN